MATHCKQGHEFTLESSYVWNGKRSCKICRNVRARVYDKRRRPRIVTSEQSRRTHMKHRYGLNKPEYDALLIQQDGLCAICHKPPEYGEILAADHDHKCCPGERTCGRCIRGLTHRNCNAALGMLGDDPSICRFAADYLEKKRG